MAHFERVEGPLERVDGDLTERLEEMLAKAIRARVKDGAPAAEIKQLVRETKAALRTAEQKLR